MFEAGAEKSLVRYTRVPLHTVGGPLIQDGTSRSERRLAEQRDGTTRPLVQTAIAQMLDELSSKTRFRWFDVAVCYANDLAARRSHPFVTATVDDRSLELFSGVTTFSSTPSAEASTFELYPAVVDGQVVSVVETEEDEPRFLFLCRRRGRWSTVWRTATPFRGLVLENGAPEYAEAA